MIDLINQAKDLVKMQEALMGQCMQNAEKAIDSIENKDVRDRLTHILGEAKAGRMTPEQVANEIQDLSKCQ